LPGTYPLLIIISAGFPASVTADVGDAHYNPPPPGTAGFPSPPSDTVSQKRCADYDFTALYPQKLTIRV